MVDKDSFPSPSPFYPSSLSWLSLICGRLALLRFPAIPCVEKQLRPLPSQVIYCLRPERFSAYQNTSASGVLSERSHPWE